MAQAAVKRVTIGPPRAAPAAPLCPSPPIPDTADALEPTLYEIARLCLAPGRAACIAERDWPAIIPLALQHGVAPLLHLRVKDQQLPEAVRTELRSIYRANLARNLLLGHQQRALLTALRERAGSANPLKGPWLSLHLYGDLGARQVADLDFLIRPEDLPAADEALVRLGFHRFLNEPLERMSGCRDVLYLRESANGAPLAVDLHLRLRPYGRRDALSDQICREGISQENLLLYLCLNLITHRFARLLPYLDLVAFLRKEGARLNWKQVERDAAQLEWRAGVPYCLLLAAELNREPLRIPPTLLSAQSGTWWTDRILGRGVQSVLGRAQRLQGPRGTIALLGFESGMLQKLRLSGAILFPPGPVLRQMDAPTHALSLPAHYVDRLSRKTRQLASAVLAGTTSRNWS